MRMNTEEMRGLIKVGEMKGLSEDVGGVSGGGREGGGGEGKGEGRGGRGEGFWLFDF